MSGPPPGSGAPVPPSVGEAGPLHTATGDGGRDGRVAALLLAALGLAAAGAALGFRVAFVTDPLGPRAFPLLAAGLLLAGAVGLWRRPGGAASWPGDDARRRVAGVTAALVAWSVAMPLAGFVPTTTLMLAWLGRLFGARTWTGLAVGLAVAVGLQALFGFALGLPLPAGPVG